MSGEKTIFNMTAWLGADITEFQSKMNAAKTQSDLLKNTLADLKSTLIGAFAVGGVVEFTKSCLEAYDKQAQAEAGLKTALKGRMDIYEDLKSFAEDWSYKGTVDDKTIMQQEKYLTTLGFTKDKIEETINASMELSQATGGSLDESVKALAKTYTGVLPKELSRIEALKDMTTSELKHGDAVKWVTENMAGLAEAAGSSGLSSLKNLSEAWDHLKGAFGEAVAPTLNKAADQWTQFFRVMGNSALDANQKMQYFWKSLTFFQDNPDSIKNAAFDWANKQAEANAKKGKPDASMQNNDVFKLLYGNTADSTGASSDNKKLPEQLSILDQIKKDIADITSLRDSSDNAKDIEKYNEELSKLNIKLLEHESITGRIKDKITELNELRAQSTDITKIASYNEQLKEEEEYLKRINSITPQDLADRENPLTPMRPIGLGEKVDYMQLHNIATPSADAIHITTNSTLDAYLKHLKDVMHDLNLTIKEGLKNAIATMSEGVGMLTFTLISGGDMGSAIKQFGASLLSGFANVLNQLGMILLTEAIGIEAFKDSLKSLDPALALGAAIGLFALAGVLGGAAKSLGNTSKTGGGAISAISSQSNNGLLSLGSYNSSSFLGTNMAGYATAPNMNVIVTGRISGSDISIANDRGSAIRGSKY